MKQGNYEKAEIYYKKCLWLKDEARVNVEYGYLLFIMGRYEEARKHLEVSVLETKENYNPCYCSWCYFYYGLLEYDLGNVQMSQYYLDEFVKLSVHLKISDYILKCEKHLNLTG